MSNIETNLNNLNGYILYQNSSGTQDTFTLSDNISNYSYIDIFMGESGNSNPAVYRFWVKNSQCYFSTITMLYAVNNMTSFGIRTFEYNITGTTATMYRMNNATLNSSGLTIDGDSNNWYVYKIIGYK